jgi:3-oxoacyl-[acyl-carrier protein] reductase
MDLGLTGRVAIVTGSSEGLGRGAAAALVDEGVAVVLSSRREELLAATASELTERGGKVAYLAADFGDPETPQTLVDLALERFGRIDIAVANAGGPPRQRALEFDDEALILAINNNFLSAVRLTRAVLPHFTAQGWGRICAIASTSVVQPLPGIALSNASRSALWGWAKTAAQDVASAGVTLNLICPGIHRTARQIALGDDFADKPERRSGEADDFGKIVAFCCSDAAKFMNGAAIVVDGGSTLAL